MAATKKRTAAGARGAPKRGAGARAQKPERGDGAAPSAPALVVGLGASAGGVAALEAFFGAMPATSGMAFVVVMHQLPTRPSPLPELLAHRTAMPVLEVEEPTRAAADHVYVAPPGCHLTITAGVLHAAPVEDVPLPAGIDVFFRSLARDQREKAAGIVLSGTGTDGTLGLKEIKAEFGVVLAQDERSAAYAGMLHSAIDTALVDFVAPVEEMPRHLGEYRDALAVTRADPGRTSQPNAEVLHQIFALIRDRTGHDFAHYKESTVLRRIERRMTVHHLENARRYVRYLHANPAEIDLLFKELLIGVTSFFRDEEAWSALVEPVARLLSDKPDDYVVRAWVAGCSTGEEAYSLAILLRECMDEMRRSLSVQVFATDLDPTAIEIARAGVYPLSIANDVSPQRLARFFNKDEDGYRVKKEIREMLIFAPQNVIADPPFTKLDVLSCRNLLIYLDGELQARLIPMFHYALRPGGIQLLGSSESVGAFANLFASVDKKWKVFRRQEVPFATYVADIHGTRVDPGKPNLTRALPTRTETAISYAQLAERALLKELVPPTVLVHERGEVVHVHGRTGLFLEPAQGSQATANIFNMAREGLQICLAAAMRQAAAEEREVIHRGVQVRSNGDVVSLDVRALRLREPEPLRGLFRISFEHVSSTKRADGIARDGALETQPPDRIVELERELQYTKESHQGTIEELETANEELKSTNEELQSTNEELQSANEELETSKEEMQSLNEELQTVNAELHGKVDELSRINNDMKNLLNGTDIATIFLDDELNIKRYTEQAKRVIRLIASDVGRPIGDLVSTLRYHALVEDAREVLRTLVFKEIEVQGEGDAWYLMRILPYRTTENVIDGLVLTFVDVTKVKTLQHAQQRLLDVLARSPTCAFGHDAELRYRWACGAVFGRDPRQLEGKTDEEAFGERGAPIVALKRRALRDQAPQRARVTLRVDDANHTFDVYVQPDRDRRGEVTGLSCVATDLGVTEP